VRAVQSPSQQTHSVTSPVAKPIKIVIDEGQEVSGLLLLPSSARACLVFAHGAGAGMTHLFMSALADDLAVRGIATLRYQFPYMERGSKRPDSPQVAHETVRAAIAKATCLVPGLPLFAGGKSFGGRMTSQTQASSPCPLIRGLVLFGFPLHPHGKPVDERGAHLFEVHIPMLFLQGTRDELAKLDLLQPIVKRLGARATLEVVDEADHAFHVPARTGRKDADVRVELADAVARWVGKVSAT
jgi:predicted alpha/beta-hydrolase family hydrolase